MQELASQVKEIKASLDALAKKINENKGLERVHRGNAFNKIFSVILSSFEDVLVFAERLDSHISESIEIERVIQ